MVESVIDVKVHDAQLKALLELMGRYQKSISDASKLWKKSARDADRMSKDAIDIVSALAAHFALERQIADTKEKERKAERDAERKRREEAKRRLAEEKSVAKAKADAEKKSMEFNKKLEAALVATGKKFIKFFSLENISKAVSGIFNAFGLRSMLEGVSAQRRTAMGLNIGIGEQRGLQLAFGRYGDVDSALAQIAEARADPSQWYAFSSLGITPGRKDTGQLFLETQRRIMERSQGIDPNMLGAMAGAYGWTNLMSMDQIRALQTAGSTPEGRAEFAQQEKRYALDHNEFNVKSARGWQDFLYQLDSATAKVRSVFVDKLVEMAPAIGKFAETMGNLAVNLLNRIDFERLGKIFYNFSVGISDYLASPQFLQGLDKMATAIGAATEGFLRFAEKLGWVPKVNPADVSGSSRNPGAAVGGVTPVGKFAIHPNDPGSAIRITDKNFAKKSMMESMHWWMNEGPKFLGKPVTKEQAAALAAREQLESMGSPYEVGDSGLAKGIFQWHPDRQQNITSIKGYEDAFTNPDFAVAWRKQHEAAALEMSRGKESKAFHKIFPELFGKAMPRTAEEEGRLVSEYLLRPKDVEGEKRKTADLSRTAVIIWDNTQGNPNNITVYPAPPPGVPTVQK